MACFAPTMCKCYNYLTVWNNTLYTHSRSPALSISALRVHLNYLGHDQTSTNCHLFNAINNICDSILHRILWKPVSTTEKINKKGNSDFLSHNSDFFLTISTLNLSILTFFITIVRYKFAIVTVFSELPDTNSQFWLFFSELWDTNS